MSKKSIETQCRLYLREVENSDKLHALLIKLKKQLAKKSMLYSQHKENAVCNLEELIESVIEELFYKKQCPFVNLCIRHMGYEISNFLEHNPGKDYQAALDRFIASKNIGE